jgi:hypothetical protein
MMPEQMQVCSRHFCEAVRASVSQRSCEYLEPFLTEMLDGLTDD